MVEGLHSTRLDLGCYHYDLTQQILMDSQGNTCALRHQSLKVLHYLALHANQVVTKAELFASIWRGLNVTDDSLVQCIAEIRQALQDSKHQILKTWPRRGYSLLTSTLQAKAPQSPSEGLLPLLGRAQELQDLEHMLLDPSCRLITLLGLGGVGKSRLTKAVVNSVVQQFPEGCYFIELAAVQCADLIPSAIANVLKVSLQGQRPPLEQLQRFLAGKRVLLVLDNIEHLLPEAAVCECLLASCSGLKILTTSRQPLQVYGEWLYRLQGLKVAQQLAAAPRCAAFALFMQAARRVHYQFSPTVDDQALILEICRLVNGMPLGIEIAASWLKHLSCAEVLRELTQHLQAVNPSAAATPVSALSQVVEQTWQMLSTREQQIMQMLALFRGGFTRETASALTGAGLADYGSLIDKSILNRQPNGHYVLHEVMRHYASHSYLAEASHLTTTQRFVEYYLAKATVADAVILGGQQFASIQQLAQEHDNLRECLRLCAEAKQQSAPQLLHLGLKLVGTLGMFWFLANHWQEGDHWLARFLALHQQTPPCLAQGMALLAAGGISAVLDKHSVADHYLSIGSQLAAQFGGKVEIARSLFVLSILRRLQGRYLESVDCGQQSMRLFMDAGDEGGYQINLVNVGHALFKLGRYDEAIPLFEECISLNQKLGLTLSMPYALINLGRVNAQLQQLPAARAYLQQSVQLTEQLGVLLYRAQALCALGWLELNEGKIAPALELLQSSMTDYLHLGDREGQIAVMLGIGVAKAAQGQLNLAWQCIVVAENLAKCLKLQAFAEYPALLTAAKQRIQQGLGAHELVLQRNLGLVSKLETIFNTMLAETIAQ